MIYFPICSRGRLGIDSQMWTNVLKTCTPVINMHFAQTLLDLTNASAGVDFPAPEMIAKVCLNNRNFAVQI